eukprot:NODE_1197_length_649_cov_593.810000_g938_i0.p1 GENE.NODE_1197_length_649_cov_593.810000_g938_i0~~NODE_1197_length_649_cov_593.810000_g938_i0.p1  ORF type:complete len:196 (-),score=50.80 NODE_1197_length_649_cov_593.810000_g938_i0:60-617(-)
MGLSDVTFVVQGKSIHGHRVILSAYSDVFAAMFKSSMQESLQREIILDDITPDAWVLVMQYMYCNHDLGLQFKGLSDAVVLEVMAAANKYNLRHLMLLCEYYLRARVSLNNIIQFLQASFEHDPRGPLFSACLHLILVNFRLVVDLPEFQELAVQRCEVFAVVLHKSADFIDMPKLCKRKHYELE